MPPATNTVSGSARRWLSAVVPEPGAARGLAVLVLSQSLGTGLFLTSSAVFLTRVVGLSAQQVGLGLGVAGLCGIAVSTPAGALADRFGARPPLVAVHLVCTAIVAAYGLVTSFSPFLLAVVAIGVCEGAAEPLRATLVHEQVGASAAVVRSQLRAVFNIGFAAGAALAGLALAVGTRPAFVAVVLATAASHLACAWIASRMTGGTPRAAGPRERTRGAFRDLRFLVLTAANGVLELHSVVITLAVPLWIVTSTAVGAGFNAVLLVLNTALIVLFQVRIGRAANDLTGAARAQAKAGVLLACGCAVTALSGTGGPLVGMAALLAGAVVIAWGEMVQSASAFTLSFELPPTGRQGEYQGVFAMRKGVRQAVGPPLVTWLVIGTGTVGWFALALVFAAFGVLGSLAARPRPDATT